MARCWLPFIVVAAVAFLAFVYIAYVLWPRWPGPPVGPDAPSLPITVARRRLQRAARRDPRQDAAPGRRAGARRSRLPVAVARAAATRPRTAATAGTTRRKVTERIFVTIAGSDGTLPPDERLKTIYPRYVATGPRSARAACRCARSASGTPYQGEDLIYDADAPERFLLRCTQTVAGRRRAPACTSGGIGDRRRHRALSARLARRLARGRRAGSTG